jgi:hypothetical protein
LIEEEGSNSGLTQLVLGAEICRIKRGAKGRALSFVNPLFRGEAVAYSGSVSLLYQRCSAVLGRTDVILAGLLGLGILPGCVLAQSTGNVLGRISSQEEGVTLPNALVSVSGIELEVLSGEEGWYFLTGIPVGQYEVTVHLDGFATASDSVELSPDETVVVDFQLEAEPVLVDGFVVTGESEPLGNLAHRTVIRREDIARTQASSVTQLLQGLVPGVSQTVTSGDVGASASIRIRGVRSLRSTPPLFFVDGVLVGSAGFRGPQGTGRVLAFLDNINPKDLDRIEILHAAEATTLYGTNAAGGVILIFTKR